MSSSCDGDSHLVEQRPVIVLPIHSEAKIFETVVNDWGRYSTRANLVQRLVRRRTETPYRVHMVVQEYPWSWSTVSILEYCTLVRSAGLSSRYLTTQLHDLQQFYLFIKATHSHVFVDTPPLPPRLDFTEVVARVRTENV